MLPLGVLGVYSRYVDNLSLLDWRGEERSACRDTFNC